MFGCERRVVVGFSPARIHYQFDGFTPLGWLVDRGEFVVSCGAFRTDPKRATPERWPNNDARESRFSWHRPRPVNRIGFGFWAPQGPSRNHYNRAEANRRRSRAVAR